MGSQCLWGGPGCGGAGALLWVWWHGTGAGSGSLPQRSSWAQHVPAFTPRIPAGCLANSGIGTFALAAAQQRGWERSFQGGGEVSAGAAAERARPWGASWPFLGTPQLPWPPDPPVNPCPRGGSKALGAESGQGPCSGEQEWAEWLRDAVGSHIAANSPAPMGTPALHGMAQHGTGHRDTHPVPWRAAAREAHAGCTHVLCTQPLPGMARHGVARHGMAWHGTARHSTGP